MGERESFGELTARAWVWFAMGLFEVSSVGVGEKVGVGYGYWVWVK